MNKFKNRLGNLDLLRNISMLMIIIIHALTHGGVLEILEPYTLSYYLVYILYAITMTGVNTYILISGYFLCESELDILSQIKKICSLIFKTFYYSVGVFLFLYLVGLSDAPRFGWLSTLTPVIHGQYWFITRYIAFFIMVPFLNIGIKAIKQREHKLLIIIMSILYSFIPTIFHVSGWLGAEEGYSVSWFIFLYLIASYIRKYYKPSSKKIPLIVYLSSILLMSVSNFVIISLPKIPIFKSYNTDFFTKASKLFYTQSSPLTLIATISIFLCFINIKINNKTLNNIICKIATGTFAAYLIHNHQDFKKIIWKYTYITDCIYEPYFILYLILVCIVIFILCLIIEFISQFIFKTIFNTISKLLKKNK